MAWLGWCLLALGLVVWAIGARGFADELAEFLRGDKRSGPPDDDHVDQLRQPSEHQSR